MRYPRTPGYRPTGEENSHNAWYVKTTVQGAPSGKLTGKTVALKDNIMLAGVPMMNGSATLEGYMPDIDATVVERILDAGGTIVGKAHCEAFCLSGGSHTNATGPVHNPHKKGYSAGGSSSGSAVLVALGEVDMALGGDQGGSIRMPVVVLRRLRHEADARPGALYRHHADRNLHRSHRADHAECQRQCAAARGAGGPDGYDPRQYNVKVHPYASMLEGGVKGMRIGVVTEGFQQANAEADVNAKVRDAAARLAALGAEVTEISIPLHLAGPALWMPIGVEGLTQTMMWGDGYGVSRSDLYVTSLMDFHRGWRMRANEMSETTQAVHDVWHLHPQILMAAATTARR